MKMISICGGFLLLFAIPSPAPANPSQSQVAAHNQAVELNNRGLELYKAGKIDEAIKQFRQALAIDPELPGSRSAISASPSTPRATTTKPSMISTRLSR